jgi:hypothetical protein
MSITSSDILTAVQNVTQRKYGSGALTSSDIEKEMIEVLIDLSGRGAFLPTTTSDTIAGNATSVSKPSDYSTADNLQITSGDTSGDVLGEITMTEFLKGKTPGFVVRGDNIHIRPSSSSARTYTFYYYKEHAAAVTTIEFADKFRAAIKYGVAYKVEENKKQWKVANELKEKYYGEVALLIATQPSPAAVVQMRSNVRE